MILYTYINYVYTTIQVYMSESIYQDTHGIYHVYLDISNFLRLILMLLYTNGTSPLNLQCRAMSSKCTHDLEFLGGYATGVNSVKSI